MRPSWSVAVATGLLIGHAAAQTATPGAAWTRFTEPGEHAFTVEVPEGWRVSGGVDRTARDGPTLTVRAVAPDGAAELFLEEMYRPGRNPRLRATGLRATGLGPPARELKGVGPAYAAEVGQRALGCAPAGAPWPRPDVASALAPLVTSGRMLDSGMATFSCAGGDGRLVRAAVVGTVAFYGSDGGGQWLPVAMDLAGVRTVPGREAPGVLDAMLERMAASFARAPGWDGGAENPRCPYDPDRDLQVVRVCITTDGTVAVRDGCKVCVPPP